MSENSKMHQNQKEESIYPDSNGQITLQTHNKGVVSYTSYVDSDGKITLQPNEVLLSQSWLMDNPEALREVLQGLEEGRDGSKGKSLGSFAKYLEDDDEE